jgi:NAD(P)-dependent dehydrogenase (short-subunit alcohol dehydrogenase family)
MTGKTIVLTGASAGIGRIAARELAGMGWEVAVVGRNPERTGRIAEEIGGTAFLADYDRLDDVRSLAAALLERYPRIDVLANNAGGLVGKRGETADGHERTFQHNHLAPFLLTHLLRPRLEASGARVVGTASVANRFSQLRLDDLDFRRRPYLGGWRAYGTSKLETILFAKELARRTPLEAYSFHPGSVRTAFGTDTRAGRFVMGLAAPMQITPEAGAVPLIQLVSSAEVAAPNGSYFDGLKPGGAHHRDADDPALASGLWDATVAALGL